jgi:predicted ribosomally synthesized peptide with SipW-like signal peptide
MRTYLKVLLVLGVFAVVGGGAGTFASFNATVTNAGNTFATGTLVLQDGVGSTLCLSTGGGATDTNANSTGCAKVFNVSVKKPGDTASGTVDLQNVGSLNASHLTVTSSSCTASNATGESFHGTGDPCTVLDVYVQEVDGSSNNVKCWYGGGAGGTTCSFDDTKTVAALGGAGSADLSGIAASATRHFVVGLELQPTAGNAFQGRAAAIDLTWQATQ